MRLNIKQTMEMCDQESDGSILGCILMVTKRLETFEIGIDNLLSSCARLVTAGEKLDAAMAETQAINAAIKERSEACRKTIRDEENRWGKK
jgi:hypothetical protein